MDVLVIDTEGLGAGDTSRHSEMVTIVAAISRRVFPLHAAFPAQAGKAYHFHLGISSSVLNIKKVSFQTIVSQ